MNGYLGEIRLFPFNWAPKDWLPCDGRTLNVIQNQALASLLGNMYGGDGKTTFALPDLRGRVAACIGNPQVESLPLQWGKKTGSETAEIPASILPQHSHAVTVSTATTGNISPQGGVPAISRRANGQPASNIYVTAQASKAITINSATVVPTPGAPVANMQPSLVLNFCICVQGGIYPTRS